jgi:hypothetical protein
MHLTCTAASILMPSKAFDIVEAKKSKCAWTYSQLWHMTDKNLQKFQEVNAFFLSRGFSDHDDIENGIGTVKELGVSRRRVLLGGPVTPTEVDVRQMLARLLAAGLNLADQRALHG